jgi:hypothetical protein
MADIGVRSEMTGPSALWGRDRAAARRGRSWVAGPIKLLAGAGALSAVAAAGSGAAHADAVAYLLNVTVRPGYHFANADDALTYGRGICDKVAYNGTYGAIIGDIKADFANPDEYQASYLIAQAVNELCPPLIWQLRNSAANYRPASP